MLCIESLSDDKSIDNVKFSSAMHQFVAAFNWLCFIAHNFAALSQPHHSHQRYLELQQTAVFAKNALINPTHATW